MDGNIVKEIKGETKTLAAGEKCIIKANEKVDGLHFWSWDTVTYIMYIQL